MTEPRHPIQPLVMVDDVLRFKENKIVRDLLDFATPRGFGLNNIACGDYTQEDREQFTQLIGYSHSGTTSMGHISDEVWHAALLSTRPARRRLTPGLRRCGIAEHCAQIAAETWCEPGDMRVSHCTEAADAIRAQFKEPK